MRFLSLTLLAAALFAAPITHAQELDSEAKVTNEQIALSKDLPSTLVVRTNPATGEVQVLHSAQKLVAGAVSQDAVAKADFLKVDATPAAATSELDQDSSRSSWYFCFNRGWGFPQYNYYGYNYSYSYYWGYNWGGWNYSYYRWNYGWWW